MSSRIFMRLNGEERFAFFPFFFKFNLKFTCKYDTL